MTTWLLLNHFYPVMWAPTSSNERERRRIVVHGFGRSLWSAVLAARWFKQRLSSGNPESEVTRWLSIRLPSVAGNVVTATGNIVGAARGNLLRLEFSNHAPRRNREGERQLKTKRRMLLKKKKKKKKKKRRILIRKFVENSSRLRNGENIEIHCVCETQNLRNQEKWLETEIHSTVPPFVSRQRLEEKKKENRRTKRCKKRSNRIQGFTRIYFLSFFFSLSSVYGNENHPRINWTESRVKIRAYLSDTDFSKRIGDEENWN